MYARAAQVSKGWCDVLRGKRPGLENNAKELLRTLFCGDSYADDRYGKGVVPRPRLMAALSLSVQRANTIPLEHGRVPYAHLSSGGQYRLPAAFDYVMEAEGGWKGLLRRFANRVRTKTSAEERKEKQLQQKQKHAKLLFKTALSGLAGEDLDASEDMTPAIWQKIQTLKDAATELTTVKRERLAHARTRGGGRYEELKARMGSE